MACHLPQLSPIFLRSRFLKASLRYSSPTALHAGFVESDSDIIFSRTAAFRATMIIVGLLIIVLIFIARWDSILECLFCHRFLPFTPSSQQEHQQQQMLNTEMQKVWSKHAVINAVPMMKYSAMPNYPECKASTTTECMICLGDFTEGDMIRILPECRHFFHAKCIDVWFVYHISCPACRTSVAPSGSTLFFQAQ